MPSILIPRVEGPLDATVVVPGSKSMTNRVMVLAALANGRTTLRNALMAEDTQVMMEGLRSLGFEVVADEVGSLIRVQGGDGRIPNLEADVFCGNSGTTARFLTALCSTGQGLYTLEGHRRMRERPMGPLCGALQRLGAGVEYLEGGGRLPIRVHAKGLRAGQVLIDAHDSSQFVSALLMAAPRAGGDVFIEAESMPSRPYVAMTMELMHRFGAEVIAAAEAGRWIVPAPQSYSGLDIEIEPDASAGAYFFAAAAAVGGRVTVRGLGRNSIQGDLGFVNLLEAMGCKVDIDLRETVVARAVERAIKGIDVDLTDMPDVAPTLACLAVLAEGSTRIRGLATLKLKESDRIGALAHELRRVGAVVESGDDELFIEPPGKPAGAVLNTYDDHRLAMSFAILGLAVEGIRINDPECVAKTYPGFFNDLLIMTHASPRDP